MNEQDIKAKIRNGYVMNTHGTMIHMDARVILQPGDQAQYGGARFIDAETFVKKHPLVDLSEGCVIGIYFYEGSTYHRPPGRTPIYDVPTVYRLNNWK